jgi:hypothetical protein
MKKLFFGESYQNKTDKAIQYKLFYINCFGYIQHDSGSLEPNQTLTITRASNKAYLYL